jgi:hypothetical protein
MGFIKKVRKGNTKGYNGGAQVEYTSRDSMLFFFGALKPTLTHGEDRSGRTFALNNK